jgi:hypothetical protein
VKRSWFSLAVGCLLALVINSFTARPLLGDSFHPQRFEQAAGSGSMSESAALIGRRESPGATRLALQAAGQ